MVSDDPLLARVKRRHASLLSVAQLKVQVNAAAVHESKQDQILRRLDAIEKVLADVKAKSQTVRAERETERIMDAADKTSLLSRVESLEFQMMVMQLDQKGVTLYGAFALLASEMDAKRIERAGARGDTLADFRARLEAAVAPSSPVLMERQQLRPILKSALSPAVIRRMFEGFDLEQRHRAAHPNLRPPKLLADLFALEALDYDLTSSPSPVELTLRAVLAAPLIDDVRSWMNELTSKPELYQQPTTVQLERWAKYL